MRRPQFFYSARVPWPVVGGADVPVVLACGTILLTSYTTKPSTITMAYDAPNNGTAAPGSSAGWPRVGRARLRLRGYRSVCGSCVRFLSLAVLQPVSPGFDVPEAARRSSEAIHSLFRAIRAMRHGPTPTRAQRLRSRLTRSVAVVVVLVAAYRAWRSLKHPKVATRPEGQRSSSPIRPRHCGHLRPCCARAAISRLMRSSTTLWS
jgi:hypothetical protein